MDQEYRRLRFILMSGWRVFVGQPPAAVVRLSLLLCKIRQASRVEIFQRFHADG